MLIVKLGYKTKQLPFLCKDYFFSDFVYRIPLLENFIIMTTIADQFVLINLFDKWKMWLDVYLKSTNGAFVYRSFVCFWCRFLIPLKEPIFFQVVVITSFDLHDYRNVCQLFTSITSINILWSRRLRYFNW